MRKLARLSAVITSMTAAMLMSSAVMADDSAQGYVPNIDFHGYFRAGVGSSRDGGNIAWQKNYIGRLGNEDDTYGEVELGSQVYKINDLSFYVDTMVAMSSKGSTGWESTQSDNADFAFVQYNLQVKGLVPNHPEAVVWAGKRYYQRQDIHIIDTKYLDISGSGAGLEYLKVGPGSLSLAWLRRDDSYVDYRYEYLDENGQQKFGTGQSQSNINWFDARYAGSYWKGGWLEFAGVVAVPGNEPSTISGATDANGKPVEVNAERVYDNGTSAMLSVILSQDMLGGYNKTVLQYATNGLAHNMSDMGSGWYDSWNSSDGASGFRIINTGEIPVTNDFSFTHVLTYGMSQDTSDNSNVDKTTFMQAVARAAYQTTQYTRILAEVGAFKRTTQYLGDVADFDEAGQKYTLAFAIAPEKGIMSRPELRIYASYINSSGDTYVNNSNGDQIYDNNFNFGVQAEAWW